MIEVAVIQDCDGKAWKLWHRPSHCSNGWHSLKLEGPHSAYHGKPPRKNEPESGVAPRKKYFWLGWNGERLASSSDAKILVKRHPDIAEAVTAQLLTVYPCVSRETINAGLPNRQIAEPKNLGDLGPAIFESFSCAALVEVPVTTDRPRFRGPIQGTDNT